MTKALFFDIDGTLVPLHSLLIPDDTITLLNELRDNNVKLFLATGRPVTGITNFINQFKFDGYLTSILAKIGIDGVNSNLATAIRTMIVVLMSWGMVFLTNAQGGITDISKKSWIFLILSGIATGASWLCYS